MTSFISLNELKNFEPLPGLKAKVVHTKTQTFAFWKIEKGTILQEHHHHHEQVCILTNGELELTVNDEAKILTKGMFVCIPSNAKHSARAITDVELTDVFTPNREDFKI